MKNIIVWLPLAAVIGGIVGAWGPMEELRMLKEREDEAKVAARPAKRGGFNPLSQLINVPDAAKRPRRAKKPKPAAPVAKGKGDAPATNAAQSAALPSAETGKKTDSPRTVQILRGTGVVAAVIVP